MLRLCQASHHWAKTRAIDPSSRVLSGFAPPKQVVPSGIWSLKSRYDAHKIETTLRMPELLSKDSFGWGSILLQGCLANHNQNRLPQFFDPPSCINARSRRFFLGYYTGMHLETHDLFPVKGWHSQYRIFISIRQVSEGTCQGYVFVAQIASR